MTSKSVFRFSIGVVFLVLTLLFQSCSTSKKAVADRENKKPEWVTSRPVDNNYYQGVGVAMVNNFTQGHVEEAKKKALQDIISEISVNIQSTSMLQRIEKNEELSNMYESMTRISAENDIEGYELYDSWGDDKSYWVYYRLSKDLYRQNEIRKMQRAKSQAMHYYNAGLKAMETEQIARAYEDFVKGLTALREHLNADIRVDVPGGSDYLADVLLRQVTTLNRDLSLTTDIQTVKTRVARAVPEPITVTILYRNKPVPGMKLSCDFVTGAGQVPEALVSDENGQATFKIQRVTGGEANQLLSVSPDVETMAGEPEGQALITALIRSQSSVSSVRINIQTVRIIARFESTEQQFGKTVEGQLSRTIRKHLSESAYSFSSGGEDIDAVVKVSISSEKGEEHQLKNVKLYTAFVDCYISITDARTGNQVYYKGFSRVKGSRAGGFDQAVRDAEDKVLEQFRTELLPEINNVDL